MVNSCVLRSPLLSMGGVYFSALYTLPVDYERYVENKLPQVCIMLTGILDSNSIA